MKYGQRAPQLQGVIVILPHIQTAKEESHVEIPRRGHPRTLPFFMHTVDKGTAYAARTVRWSATSCRCFLLRTACGWGCRNAARLRDSSPSLFPDRCTELLYHVLPIRGARKGHGGRPPDMGPEEECLFGYASLSSCDWYATMRSLRRRIETFSRPSVSAARLIRLRMVRGLSSGSSSTISASCLSTIAPLKAS